MRVLARHHSVNPKTVAKWKKRESTADRRTGPTVPKSTVLSVEQEAIIVAFRKHTLLPLDDCLFAAGHDPTAHPLFPSSVSGATVSIMWLEDNKQAAEAFPSCVRLSS